MSSLSSANVSSPESVITTPPSEQPNGSSNNISRKAYAPEISTPKTVPKYKHSPNYVENERSPKRLKETTTVEKQSQQLSPPLMQAAVAAAVAAAANAGHQYPVRPLNVHSSKINANCSRLMSTPSICSNPIPRNANAMSSDIAVSIFIVVVIVVGTVVGGNRFRWDFMWVCLLFLVGLALAEFCYGLYVAYSSSTTSIW